MNKTIKWLTLAFGLLAGGPRAMAWEPAPWTRTDTLWEVGFVGIVAADCAQSSQIVALGRYERNPFLPRHPDPKTMRFICLGSVTGHYVISRILPVEWRRRWQVTTFALEVATVADNYFEAGISIKF
ncbi:MAG: hypothetical protein P4L36_02455 [Holophaga sp.]|nr:hypothetical protein [Holophaga sp.]